MRASAYEPAPCIAKMRFVVLAFCFALEIKRMAKEFAKRFLRSKPWRNCRAGYIAERIKIDGGMCEVCHENPGYIVHHKILLTPENINDPEISLNWNFLSYECKECHDQHEGHGVKRSISPVCAFDSDGNPIEIYSEFECNRL